MGNSYRFFFYSGRDSTGLHWQANQQQNGENLLVSPCPPAQSISANHITNRTGASGYIGGEVLHVLQTAHPEYEFTVLLRNKEKADQVVNAYPKVRVVLGDLDSSALLEEEAHKADVVVRKLTFLLIAVLCC